MLRSQNSDEERMGDHWEHVTPDQEDRFSLVGWQDPTGKCSKAGYQEVRRREGRPRGKGLFLLWELV